MTPRLHTAIRRLLAAVLCVAAAVASAAEPPRRIVSTSPSLTETVFALELGDRVVGVSQYCRYPDAVLALPKVGTFLKPDVELIARLKPDLVLIHSKADGLAGRLSAVGLRAAAVDHASGLSGVYSLIRSVADAAGVSDRGRDLAARVEKRMGALRESGATGPRPRVLLIVGRRPGMLSDIVAVGRRAYLGELVEVAGGANVLDDPDLPEYPRISLETVIRLKPDVIIDTGDMGDTPEERQRAGRSNLALWRGNALIAAVGIKRIHAATTNALVVPGPRVVEATEWLRALIQEDRVP